MKYLFASVCTIITLLLFSFTTKDIKEVKSQNEELKNIQKGEYTVYLTHKKDDGSYMGGFSDYHIAVIELASDKNFPNEHYEVMIEENWTESKSKYTGMYLAGNLGFPATYVNTGYEGNPKMQKEIGFAPSFYSDSYLSGKRVADKRVVFLEGRIYIIKGWKNKDDYNLKAVAEYGEAPKGFKMVKALLKTPKKMAALDPDKVLQEYLDAAHSEQQKHIAKHKAGEKKLNTLYNEIMKAIKGANNEYWNSEEGQAVAARVKKDFAVDESTKVVTIKNVGKNSICLSTSSGTKSLSAGSSTTFQCDNDVSYGVDKGSGCRSGGSLIVGKGQGCGKTIEVQ